MSKSEYLNAKEAAEVVGVSVDQIKKLITRGELPAVDVGIESRIFWRIARADLDGWLEKRRQATARTYGGAA